MTAITVDRPVCTMQFDLACIPQPVIDPSVTSKDLACREISPGRWRCILFRLNREVVSGKVAQVAGFVSGISSVVAADPDANLISVVVGQITSPTGLTVVPRLQ